MESTILRTRKEKKICTLLISFTNKDTRTRIFEKVQIWRIELKTLLVHYRKIFRGLSFLFLFSRLLNLSLKVKFTAHIPLSWIPHHTLLFWCFFFFKGMGLLRFTCLLQSILQLCSSACM